MVLRPKHYAVVAMALILSLFIFWVNYSWYNPLDLCIYLSMFTFFFVYGCFGVYWEIRDIWQYRWYAYHLDTAEIEITPLQIPLTSSKNNGSPAYLYGEFLHHPKTSPNSPIIIFSHGFSDDCHYIRHYLIPLALAGWDILAYDMRGVKRSRKTGSPHQFVNVVKDLGDILHYVTNNTLFQSRPIYLVGISLGALASIHQGLLRLHKGVEKIIGIATIADFRMVLPTSPIPFTRHWVFWLRYSLFGIPLNPLPDENFILSPSIQLEQVRRSYENDDEWKLSMKHTLFLIHDQTDKVVNINHFVLNRKIAELPFTQWVMFKRGGHNFLQAELGLIAAIESFLRQ